MNFGFTPVRPEKAVHIQHEDHEPANLVLVLGAYTAALMIGVALVWALAWIATHLQAGPFLVSFVAASICMRAFR